MLEQTSVPTSQPDSSEQFYGLLTILLSIFTLAIVFIVSQYSKMQTSVAITEVLPAGLPQGYHLANTFKTKGGKVAEVFNLQNQTKIKLAISEIPAEDKALSTFDLESMLRAFSKEKILPTGIPDFLIRYGAAQYDYRRVANFQPTSLQIGNQQVPAKTFLSSKSIFYLAGLMQTKKGTVFFIAERPEEAVLPAQVESFLSPLMH